MPTEDTRDQLIEKYGEDDILRRGVLDQKFKVVLDSLIQENDELDRLTRQLRRQLDDATSRKRDVLVILGTLYWLEENIVDTSVLKEAVSGVLDQDMRSYRGLMDRLEVLLSLTPAEKRTIALRENFEPREAGKFCGVEEQKPAFWCPECNLGFRDIDDLNRHAKSKCKYKGEEAFYRKRAEEERAKIEAEASYCAVCDYQAQSPSGLSAHKRGKAHKEAETQHYKKAAKIRRKNQDSMRKAGVPVSEPRKSKPRKRASKKKGKK